MNPIFMAVIAIASMLLVGYMLVKKMDIKMTLLIVGILLMYVSIFSGQGIAIRDFESTGSSFLDPIFAVVVQFKATLGRAGFIILILGGYTGYMSAIGANKVTVNSLTRPIKKIKSVYILVPVVFLLGNLLSLVIPSASVLSIILLATLYPVLKEAGMSTLTAAGIIATAATIMPTPLGGDNVAIAAELATYPTFKGLTPSDYVFGYHALVSIPTLLVMALVHYFWQKRCDKISSKNVVTDEKDNLADIEKIEGGLLYKVIYSILPILPIVMLLIVYIGGLRVKISVEVASFTSFIIALVCEFIRKRKSKEVLENTSNFFKGMGNSIDIVALLVCAGVFVIGLKSIGVISSLQNLMTGLGDTNLAFILPLVLVLITAVVVLLSGSGIALFYSMVPLMVPLAVAASINPLAVTIPMGLAGNLFRAVSPVSAVVCIVAGTTKKSPMEIVKRTSVPMISGIVFMFILSMIIFL